MVCVRLLFRCRNPIRWVNEGREMKIVYVSHPIGGAIETNLADLRRIIRRINLEYADVIPFCPYYADVVSLDDNVHSERARGIANNREILRSGIVRELWLTGAQVSMGMELESNLAIELGIPIIDLIGKL